MVISIEQAVRILSEGKYVLIETTDHRLAVVPKHLEAARLTASEAINSLYYVVKGESIPHTRSLLNQIGRYREIRGAC